MLTLFELSERGISSSSGYAPGRRGDVQAIGVGRDGGGDLLEVSVALLKGSDGDTRDEVGEEGKRGRGNVNLTVLVPDAVGAVKLFSGGEGGQVPGVSVVAGG
jgi:hypothetical protein